MSAVSLKLVHSRPFHGAADDFALAFLLSFIGLGLDLAVISAGILLV